ncbi:glycosyltransferase family protein, partial [bacterium]|nr:glycosyltransferase family protein [bacterium]
ALYEELLQSHPDHEDALFNLGNLRQRNDEFELAVALYQELLKRKAFHLGAWVNLGEAYKSLSFYDKSETCFRRALALDFNYVTAHWNLAHLLLSLECWREGWAEYEWRLRRPATFSPQGMSGIPGWKGEDLSGRSILLWVEQGAGDAIQFIRFISLLFDSPTNFQAGSQAVHSGKVIIYCPTRLTRLLATAPGVDQVISYEHSPPKVDFQLSLLSLPYRLVLADVDELCCDPYLQVPPAGAVVDSGVDFNGGDFKVGLVWAGNPLHENDSRRSLSLSDFHGLLAIRNVSFFSFQVFSDERNLNAAPKLPSSVVNLAPLLYDFAETARWLSQVDLLITVDTAIAHLAGALGCSCWVLLPYDADWRWSRGRSDSLWYPSLRLFRQ